MSLPDGARYVRGDDVRSVPVRAAAGLVVPHRGAWIGVRGGLLHVAQRDPGIQRSGDERVPKRMRRDGLRLRPAIVTLHDRCPIS
jgi:hypothetical protein